jgi:hypothetical protein
MRHPILQAMGKMINDYCLAKWHVLDQIFCVSSIMARPLFFQALSLDDVHLPAFELTNLEKPPINEVI